MLEFLLINKYKFNDLPDELRAKAFEYFGKYVKEIGGLDTGIHGIVGLADYFVLIFDRGLVSEHPIGFILLKKSFNLTFVGERSVIVSAIFIDNPYRSRRLLALLMNEFVLFLEKQNFHCIQVYHDTPGIMTEVGYQIINVFMKRGLRMQERLKRRGSKVRLGKIGGEPYVLLNPERYNIEKKARERHLSRKRTTILKIKLKRKMPPQLRKLLKRAKLL